MRGPLGGGSPLDLWMGPLWGTGSLDGGPCWGPPEGGGPQARGLLPGLAVPGLIGKPLYFKCLNIVSLSPPDSSSSSSSSSSRLVISQSLRKEGNAKMQKGQTHEAIKLYKRVCNLGFRV